MNTDTTITVDSLMTANVTTVCKDDLLYDAIRTLELNALSALPVVDASGKICGILSKSDILGLAYNLQCDLSALSAVSGLVRKTLTDVLTEDNCDAKVESAMTGTVETVRASATITDAAQALCNSSIHHLPVVDDIGIPIGIVSTIDIVRAVAFPLLN